MKNINKMSILDLTVKCFRKQGSESIELKIKYEDLLPGDVFEVQNNYTIPVDCVLVRGELVMNEGMLTGESVPITKHELP
jgi:P-type E1-E2 ATPase